ncbi:MAG: pyridoxal-phosphate dependent enzyme [Leptolyngbyaceae cyanobacterium SM1_4_3]|nr:pyridoxal-phosphate dependent enzyme [Leptolyngbyaceae cyanobacterium SM1_4_3]NJN91654.1 pyridoxal-phosphate dependent enzyme [Leptolyngbyaceae cyanobacterium SL_5_14]
MNYSSISCENISQAYQIIDPVFLNSPQFELDALNAILNTRIVLKVETLNPIRSFKGRGTDYFVKQHAQESAFVCASAGNFGQGMAFACRKQNIPLTVFAAETVNPLKLQRMRQLGAEVKLTGVDFDAAKETGKAYALARNYTYVEDGREIEISTGAGTIGFELSRYPEPIDTLLIPLGNGALINGVGAWFKSNRFTTRVIGVVAAGAPSMDLSWHRGYIVATETTDTISDGIAVRNPVPEALDAMKVAVDDIVQVSDEATLEAMKLVHELVGIVLEPAGAVALAAAMIYRNRFAEQLVAIPLCGSNLAKEQMQQWL